MFCTDSALRLQLLHRFHAQHIASILVAVRLTVEQLGYSRLSCAPVLHSMSIATQLYNRKIRDTFECSIAICHGMVRRSDAGECGAER